MDGRRGAEGILILPGDAVVGQPFAEHLGRSQEDRVYDLEITPNRPDLNGVIGLAREIAALTGNPLKLPDTNFQEGSSSMSMKTLPHNQDRYKLFPLVLL